MKRWFRRFGYLVVILVWLLIMAFPVVSFTLATRGQMQLGEDGRSHLRLFMVNADDGAGVGIEWTRRAGDACLRTSVNYLLWEGSSQPASYCQCSDPATGALTAADAAQCR